MGGESQCKFDFSHRVEEVEETAAVVEEVVETAAVVEEVVLVVVLVEEDT